MQLVHFSKVYKEGNKTTVSPNSYYPNSSFTLPLPQELRYEMVRDSLESSERGIGGYILLPSFFPK